MLGHAAASGRFFVDPTTGAIRKTELSANSATETVVSTVTYAEHRPLELWLPQKMMQTFEWKELRRQEQPRRGRVRRQAVLPGKRDLHRSATHSHRLDKNAPVTLLAGV